MNRSSNLWDTLGSKFNIHQKKDQIDPRVADNVLIAWPSILKVITKEYPNSTGIKVLDFGCGTGGFCNKLLEMGFDVTGIDQSAEMIRIAKQNSPSSIRYIIGKESDVPSLGKFHTIVSIMTLPFIKNITAMLTTLTSTLHENGTFIFAVFNPAWVTESLKNNMWFADFDSTKHPKNGWKTFGNIRMPVYIRDAEEYDKIASRYELIKIMEEKPPFTREFIQKYPNYVPNNVSEYLILGYKKGG